MPPRRAARAFASGIGVFVGVFFSSAPASLAAPPDGGNFRMELRPAIDDEV